MINRETEHYLSIHIGNMDPKQAQIVKDKLTGKSYMDFQVICAPIGGSICVSVATYHGVPREEFIGMVLFNLASELV